MSQDTQHACGVQGVYCAHAVCARAPAGWSSDPLPEPSLNVQRCTALFGDVICTKNGDLPGPNHQCIPPSYERAHWTLHWGCMRTIICVCAQDYRLCVCVHSVARAQWGTCEPTSGCRFLCVPRLGGRSLPSLHSLPTYRASHIVLPYM